MSRGEFARFGDFELDLGTGELRRGGSIVALRPQPAKALVLLVRNAGRLLTRDELRHCLWPDTHVSFDESLNSCIRQVRAALGEHASSAKLLQTVARRGYRFVGDVTIVSNTLPGVGTIPAAGTARAHVAAPRIRWRLALAAAIAVLSVGLFNAVNRKMQLQVRETAARGSTQNRERAGAAYQKARYALSRQDPTTARKYLEEAIAEDPSFASAYASLTEAALALGDTTAAAAAADHAIRLAPRLAEAHQAIGDVASQMHWDWRTALGEYESAIALSPADAAFRQRRAYVLSLLGRHSEALREIDEALRLDPVSPLVNGDAAWLYLYARKPGEAARHARATVELAPDFAAAWYCLIVALEAEGKASDARAVAARVARKYGASPAVAARMLANAPAVGLDAFWRWDLAQMQAHGMGDRYPIDFAAAYARFRQTDSALVFLNRAVAPGAVTSAIIAVDPRFDALRSEPEFRGLIARLRLPT